MTTLVFGVGFGTFIILALWILAGLICLISLRIQKKLGLVALGLVGIITIALLSIPRALENSGIKSDKLYDEFFIWRILLLISLGASSLVTLFAYIKLELMTPVRSVRLRNWVL